MHYFSQMRWPVSFLSSPSFLIMCIIVWCDVSTSPLVWGWWGMQSFDTKDLAQVLNYTTGEASTSIA